MKNKEIKVGFCVAYDWYLLKNSLPLIYDKADQICVSIDKNRKSWTGQKFLFDEDRFAAFIFNIDSQKKIRLYEDDFYVSNLSPMENEVRQRNMMAGYMGNGGWHVQLDTDEYFINFNGFVEYLKGLAPKRKVNVCCPFITLFKETDKGYLLIKSSSYLSSDFIPIASLHPHYEFGRKNGYFNIKTDFFILHQSWARSENEVIQKLQNWGHKEDFDVDDYFTIWKKLDWENYHTYQNFHPIVPGNWERLEFISASSIGDLMNYFSGHQSFKISKSYLHKENSIWLSRLRSLLKSR